jgi:hypothetical protein
VKNPASQAGFLGKEPKLKSTTAVSIRLRNKSTAKSHPFAAPFSGKRIEIMTEEERRGPIAANRKTHVVEAHPQFKEWPLTLCGNPVNRMLIAEKNVEPTCAVCLRKKKRGDSDYPYSD